MTSDEAPLRRGGGMKYASQALPRRRLLFLALALGSLLLFTGCATDGAKKHTELGRTYWYQSKWKEAEVEFRKAIWVNPDYADAHISLGVLLASQKRNEEAISEFRESIRLKPKDAQRFEYLAWYLDRLGRRKEARGYWTKAEKLEKRPDILTLIKNRLAEPR